MKRLAFPILIIAAVSISAQAKYSGGSGTAGNPYRIGSSADLLALAADTGDYHKCFVLTTDIDLDPDLPGGQVFSTAVIAPDTDGATWSFEGVGFTGIFDGAGCKIINLVIDTAGAGNHYLGLFGSLEGEVKNLGLENITVTGGSGSEDIGGLVGNNSGTISSCYSTGTVTGVHGLYYLGGLVGYNGGNISYCCSIGTVTGGNGSSYLGGLVGSNQDGDISDCYSMGAVTGGGGSTCLGGLVGGNYYGSISNCYSTGDVNGGDYARYLGGLAGDNYMGSTSNCYATGTVSGVDYSEDLGGLVGWNGSTISNCYSTGAVHGGDESVDIGGLVGKNYSHTVVNCYSTGAVTGGGGSICLGGLVGSYIAGSISSCYFLITSGPANGYGQPLTDAQMKQQGSFVGWDFIGETANGTEDIWIICEGIGYPKLAWQYVVGLTFPLPDAVLAGEVTLAAYTREDIGIAGVYFYLREPNSGSGIAIGYEDLAADFNNTTGQWEYNLDTNQVSNGDYIILAKAVDGCDNAVFSYPVPIVVLNLEVTKCTVIAGSKDNSDAISFSGAMNATTDDISAASSIEVTIDSNDMVNPCVQTFPINETSFNKGKYNYARTENASKRLFKFDTKTGKFSFMAKNIDLSGLGCPLTIEIKIGDYTGEAEVNEAIVNGPKKPIPIKLMMGVKNSLRVDRYKVKRGTKPNTDQLSVKGGFAVEDPNVNLAAVDFVVGLAGQTWTIPAGSFTAKNGIFTCKNVVLLGGGIANARLNLNTCVFTMRIKNTTITAVPGAANFSVEFADFSESVPIVLP